MKTLESVEIFLREEPKIETADACGHLSSELEQAAGQIIKMLLEEELPPRMLIHEASIHRGKRSHIFVATFTAPTGGQVWKTTGSRDYQEALMLAQQWEAEAKTQRATLGRSPRKAHIRVSGGKQGPAIKPLTQEQVAKILKMSVRSVRQIEHRAISKLRNHPMLRELWRQFLSGELNEDYPTLTPTEIEALFDLGITVEELSLIEKIVEVVQP
jgi:hypothetical protein